MEWMTRADTVLMAFAAYFAVMALVRMMQRRRDQLVAHVQRQVEAHRKRAKRARVDDAEIREAA
jgi:hypothetical protein